MLRRVNVPRGISGAGFAIQALMNALSPAKLLPTLETSAARYFTFFSSYFLQGLVPGLFLGVLLNYFIKNGFAAGAVGGIVALVGLPWSFQFFWGPVVDGFRSSKMGGRRFWQVVAYTGCIACLLAMCALVRDPIHHVKLLTGILVVHSFFASLMDVAVDALMIDHAPEEEKGKSGAAGRTGVVVGNAVSTLAFSFLLNRFGFTFCVTTLTFAWLAIGSVLMLIRENKKDAFFSWRRLPAAQLKKIEAARPRSAKEFVKELFQSLASPTAIKLCVLFFVADFFMSSFGVGFGVDLIQKFGWTDSGLSQFQGSLSLFGGTVLSFGVGYFSDRIGHFKAMRILLALCAGVFAFSSLLFTKGWGASLSPIVVVMQTLVPSLIYVAATPAILSLDDSPLAATRFTLIMNAMNFGDISGAAAAGQMGKWLSSPVFALVVAGVLITGAMALRKPPKPASGAVLEPVFPPISPQAA
jgi:MFS family permease